ncbi:hypothetical protein [Aliarcobacter cryaerophilus]|uniref:hypothetical protein n=1 Tax=Aliarcobacter cryaerophilus TaxID=28198 RepID=UPI0021B32B54|nr:hypothetical protein [Aliarcobacter cryaerophilus]MCT7527430.1 hypothetical protein [Aliarcobacter cryaerophilus]MCT7542487.1 hypothetical protein [Aliarcobacter cryaerophilus]
MLLALLFLIGGALGAVACAAFKKYYDENDIEIHEKLVALDKYKDSLNLNESLKDKFNYESFDIKEQELIKKVISTSGIDILENLKPQNPIFKI